MFLHLILKVRLASTSPIFFLGHVRLTVSCYGQRRRPWSASDEERKRGREGCEGFESGCRDEGLDMLRNSVCIPTYNVCLTKLIFDCNATRNLYLDHAPPTPLPTTNIFTPTHSPTIPSSVFFGIRFLPTHRLPRRLSSGSTKREASSMVGLR